MRKLLHNKYFTTNIREEFRSNMNTNMCTDNHCYQEGTPSRPISLNFRSNSIRIYYSLFIPSGEHHELTLCKSTPLLIGRDIYQNETQNDFGCHCKHSFFLCDVSSSCAYRTMSKTICSVWRTAGRG